MSARADRRRRSPRPLSPKPTIIIAHVAGSGTTPTRATCCSPPPGANAVGGPEGEAEGRRRSQHAAIEGEGTNPGRPAEVAAAERSRQEAGVAHASIGAATGGG